MTTVREAEPDDHPAVTNVLDGAMLETGDVAARIDAGDALVATDGGRIVGALVLVEVDEGNRIDADARIDAVAVRRRRRDQGIGAALVAAAAERADRLVAAFDADVRPFYESLGFRIEEREDGRLRGVR